MDKVLKTLLVSAFVTVASVAGATTANYTTSQGDTLQSDNTSALDSVSQRLATMESRMTSLEDNAAQAKVWKRKRYFKIGMANPSLKRTDGQSMDWKTDYSFFMQFGKTSYLHKKPIAGMIKFGIDWGFVDFTYSKLKLKDIATSGGTRATDGFDDIVSSEPSTGDIVSSAIGFKIGMHKFDYSFHVGPSVSVNPWNHLIATAYFHVRPTASGILLDDNFSYGFGCATAAGVSVAYKVISVGLEGQWSTIKYTQKSFDGDDEDGDYDLDNGVVFNTEKFKLKQSGMRFYLALRF